MGRRMDFLQRTHKNASFLTEQARLHACQAQRALTLDLQVYTSQLITFLYSCPSLSPSISGNGEIRNPQRLISKMKMEK